MPKKQDLTGKIFNRLTVKAQVTSIKGRTAWECLCECGKTIILTANKLTTNDTKSCGCLKKENDRKIIKLAHKKNIKLDPIIFSAKNVWWATYKEANGISFEDFYTISQMNCFYCDIAPATKYERSKNNNSYTYGMKNIQFIYNGLDRINSNLTHTKNNVVPCCPTCNRAKSNLSFAEFLLYINHLISTSHPDLSFYRNQSLDIVVCDLSKKYFGSSVKCTYKDNYSDGDLNINQFYQLSQLNCYYCNKSPQISNKANKEKKVGGEFHYNGLDRIDRNLPHHYSNLITCCYACNFAKSKLSFGDFIVWISRLKNHYSKLSLVNLK